MLCFECLLYGDINMMRWCYSFLPDFSWATFCPSVHTFVRHFLCVRFFVSKTFVRPFVCFSTLLFEYDVKRATVRQSNDFTLLSARKMIETIAIFCIQCQTLSRRIFIKYYLICSLDKNYCFFSSLCFLKWNGFWFGFVKRVHRRLSNVMTWWVSVFDMLHMNFICLKSVPCVWLVHSVSVSWWIFHQICLTR